MNLTKTVFATLAALLLAGVAQAQYNTYDYWDEPYIVQALLGAVQYENLKFDVENGTETEEIDLSIIPQLGAGWGTLPKGDRFQYGLECSFLLGFMLDEITYLAAGGGGLYVNISTSMWMFDLAGGPYASLFLDKNKKLRIYAAGGPLMTYADYRTDRDYSDASPDQSTQESAFGLGLYARTGFEFRIHRKGMLGMGARGTWSTVDFTEIGGSSELVGIAAFVSYTAGF